MFLSNSEQKRFKSLHTPHGNTRSLKKLKIKNFMFFQEISPKRIHLYGNC